MKRIHLFEFEDFDWFPSWLRDCMTRYINMMHRLLGSAPELAGLLARALEHTEQKEIVDLCSGGGGPMPEVAKLLRDKHGIKDLKLTLTDLYPNKAEASRINADSDQQTQYLTEPVDATNVGQNREGVRTMVCSMHHMRPETAKAILKDAKDDHQPIVIFEISDNSQPKWIWWMAIPVSFLMVFFLTPLVRPMSWQQIVFTYIIPLIPLFIAWDGAVSNARTYTLNDMDLLLEDLTSEDYQWETGILKGKAKKAYLLGLPKKY